VSQKASLQSKLLRDLARLYGVQPSHYDVSGQLHRPPPEALLAVLRILGAPVEKFADLSGAVRTRQQFLFEQMIDPVIVVWQGQPGYVKLRVPDPLAQAAVRSTVELESGATLTNVLIDDDHSKPLPRVVEGSPYVTRRMKFSSALPLGYHRMRLEIGGRATEHFLFSAPARAYGENHGTALCSAFENQLGHRRFFRPWRLAKFYRKIGRGGGRHVAALFSFSRRAVQSESLCAGKPVVLERVVFGDRGDP